MRERKYRGKRFDNNHNDWIYGFLHVIDTCGEGYTGKAIQQQSGMSRPYSVRVHDDSVGEYTGLKDINGREVYEGDIYQHVIQLFFDGTYQEIECRDVVYFERGVYWVGEYLLVEALEGDDESFVIGNIYENPELLEGESN